MSQMDALFSVTSVNGMIKIIYMIKAKKLQLHTTTQPPDQICVHGGEIAFSSENAHIVRYFNA